MDEGILEKYRKAGRIAAEARDRALRACRPGARLLDIAEAAEGHIEKKGANAAFPVNISVNEVAAHYTPTHNDEKTIEESDLVKIDVGAHVDGYIGDTAVTWCSGRNELVKGVEKVLSEAISILKPGVTVGEIGTVIEESAKQQGMGLILNLTGHTLDRYVFHGPPAILNTSNDSHHEFKEGDVVAIEPFTCPDNGNVKEGGVKEIFRFLQRRPVRSPEARRILDMAENEYSSLPFAKRWLYREISPVKVAMALRQLEAVTALEPYAVLREASGMPIAQAEHTIVMADKPIVTTRIGE